MKKLIFTTLRKMVLTLLTFWSCQFLSAQTWSPIKGVQAQDISIGSEGEVWITGKDNSIMRWNGSAFEKMKGTAKRISVGADGIPWIVTNAGKIAYYDAEDDKWMPVVGSARDIGVGAEGSVWIVGTKAVDGGFEVLKWDSEEESWEKMELGAVRIAVDGSGNPWMINDEHKIFAYIEEEEQEYEGEMLDVGMGADGSVWAITTEKGITRLEDDGWVEVDGDAIGIAATSEGSPWIVKGNGQVAKLAKLIGDEESDSDENDSDESEEENTKKTESKDVKSNQAKSNEEKTNKTVAKEEEKEIVGKGPNENKPVQKVVPAQRSGTPVEFYNSGNKPVEIYTSTGTQLGELVTEIRPNSRVKIPVNIGDEFEVGINKEIGKHPKIFITSTSENINLFGNGPLKDVQFLAEKFSILDYQSNQAGIDLTKYNPRDLVNTINKGRIFQILDIAEGIDYRIVGDGKIMKYGFEYASANHHEGTNEVSMSYGYSSFSKNWSLNVGGSGSIPVKSASVNPAMDFGYSESESEDRSYENTYAFSREQKSIFTITVDPKKAQLDEEFKDAVRNVTDREAAKEFVEQYGTHYPKLVYYGGDRSVYVVFNKEQYSKAKSFGIDLKAKVGVSKMQTKSKTYEGFGAPKDKRESSEIAEGHLGFEYKQGSEEESVFENTVSKYRMIGGSGGFDNWDVNESNAAPIASEMDMIYTLIEPKIFKDGTDPAFLAKAKSLIKAAVDNKLRSMPMLKAPLPPPNVYSVKIEKMEVIEEIDDANKKTKGSFTAAIHRDDNGNLTRIGNNYTLWSITDYSLDFKFTKGTIIYPRPKPFTFTQFADSSTGKFPSLVLNVVGTVQEKDDNVFDDNDNMTGQIGNTKIEDLNLSPGQSTEPRTFDLVFNPNAKSNRIRVTYKIRREPSEFNDKLLKW